MHRVAAHSDSEEPEDKHEALPLAELIDPLAEELGGDEGEEEEDTNESEFEIEKVLDAKRGVFPDGRMGYFVKWKGYGLEENSWVDEQDAGNAKELVDNYWAKVNLAKKARKSTDRKSLDKGRKSMTKGDTPDVAEVRPKKRGRKSQADMAKSDSEMEVDQPQPQAKKPRKSQTKKSQTETPEAITVGNMVNFMHLDDWEGLVSSVDTVERESDNSLTVYFTLNSGEFVMESSTVCNKRFPQTLIRFYESNLKWRTVEELE